MKIIDLLNKIAKGEEVPKEIKYDTMNYYFRNYDYKEVHGELIDEQTSFIERIIFYRLNDEIEIIEEEKEIEKLSWQQIGYKKVEGTFESVRDIKDIVIDVNKQIDKIGKKINEIIDELNKIKKEGK